MEYELIDEIPEERCALVTSRDGGIDSNGSDKVAPQRATPCSPIERAKPGEISPQMGEV